MRPRVPRALVATIALAASLTALAAEALGSGSGRLRRDVEPTFQALKLTLDADKPEYSGSVRIELRANVPADSFQLHAEGISIKRVAFRSPKGIVPVTFHAAGTTMITISPKTPLKPGAYTLDIDFSDTLDTRAQGLYRVETGGAGYVFSQFESDDARKAFPCWDEPSFKIPYQVTLIVPRGHQAVSNTPVQKEAPGKVTKTVIFQRTKPLPSYLLAIAAGPLESIPIPGMSIPGRIYTVKGASGLAQEAAKMAPPILAALERYFGSGYPYEKLDFIAVPEFWPGAMENAGAITFRDDVLLFDPKTGSPGQRRTVAIFMAHEVAHHWFGDLVTMEWWDDLWLNESFAEWMGNKIVDEVFPEYQVGIQDLRATQGAMTTDSRLSTRAIRQPVGAVDNLLQIADELAYQKGQAVLSMFEQWIGPDAYRKGVLAYLDAHKWGNATGADLWSALSKPSGKDVGAAMETFLDHGGLPLIEVEALPDGRVRLSQRRFLSYGIEAPAPQLWRVPIGLKYSDGVGTHTQYVLLAGADTTVALSGGKPPLWLYPNAGEFGYYRWSMATAPLLAIAQIAPEGMTPRERVGYLGNASALLQAGLLHADDFLEILSRFAGDTSPEVISAVLDGVWLVRFTFIRPDLADAYARYLRQTLGPALERFGLARRPGEAEGVSLVRPGLLRALGEAGKDPRILDYCDSLAKGYLKDPTSIDPALSSPAIHLSALRGDQALYETYRTRFETTENPAERARFLGALGYFRDPKIVEQSLRYSLEGPLRPQEVFDIPATLGWALEYEELPYKWMTENFAAVASRVPPMFLVYMPRFAGGCSMERVAAAKRFFSEETHRVPGTDAELAKVADQVSDCAGLREREGPRVAGYLSR